LANRFGKALPDMALPQKLRQQPTSQTPQVLCGDTRGAKISELLEHYKNKKRKNQNAVARDEPAPRKPLPRPRNSRFFAEFFASSSRRLAYGRAIRQVGL
jgi:hypothetical protein